jgi:hypothetical protein
MRWRVFKPNIGKLKEKGNVNRLIKVLGDRDTELRKRAASALGEIGTEESVEPLMQQFTENGEVLHGTVVSALESITNRIGAESAMRTFSELIDRTNSKNLRFDLKFDENIISNFKKVCKMCNQHSKHIYCLKKFELFYLSLLMYSDEFRYIKCTNCGKYSVIVCNKSGISDIIMDSKTLLMINSLIQYKKIKKFQGRATFFDLIQLINEIELSIQDKNFIEMLWRIFDQVIDKEGKRCFYCGLTINTVTGRRCSYCHLIVCNEHMLPESHGCKGAFKPGVGISYSQNGKVHAQEGRSQSRDDF